MWGKKIFDKLLEQCTESIDEVELPVNEYKNKYSSFTLYIALFSIIFTISIRVGIYLVYFRWHLKNDNACFALPY